MRGPKVLNVLEGNVDQFEVESHIRELFSNEYDVVIFSKCLIYLECKNELMRFLRTKNVFVNQYNPDHWKHRLKAGLGLEPTPVDRFPYRKADGTEIAINSRAALRQWGDSYGYRSRVLLGCMIRSHDLVVHFWRT